MDDAIFLNNLEQATRTARTTALHRIQSVEQQQDLPAQFQELLSHSLATFRQELTASNTTISSADTLRRVLQLQVRISTIDPIFSEELARSGALQELRRFLQFSISTDKEETEDLVYELQDLAGTILAGSTGSGSSSPSSTLAFTMEELQARLPLVLELFVSTSRSEQVQLLLHQVTTRQTAQFDVGFGMSTSVFCFPCCSYEYSTSVHGGKLAHEYAILLPSYFSPLAIGHFTSALAAAR